MSANQKKIEKFTAMKKLYESQIGNWLENGKPYEQGLRFLFTEAAKEIDKEINQDLSLINQERLKMADEALALQTQITKFGDFVQNPPPDKTTYWPWRAPLPDAAERMAIVSRARISATLELEKLGLAALLSSQKQYLERDSYTVCVRDACGTVPATYVDEKAVARSLADAAALKKERGESRAAQEKSDLLFLCAFTLGAFLTMGAVAGLLEQGKNLCRMNVETCMGEVTEKSASLPVLKPPF